MSQSEPIEGAASPPRRTVCVAMAPPGRDFNDLLRDPDGIERIVAIVQAAQPLPRPEFAAPAPATRSAAKRETPPADQAPPWGDPPAGAAPAPLAAAEGAVSAPSRTGRNGRKPPGGGGAAAEMNRRLAWFQQTDLGNAKRFVERYREMVKWVPNFGWYIWDGKRWSRKGADEYVLRAEHDTVLAIQDEADAIENAGEDMPVGMKGKGEAKQAVMLSGTLRAWGRASESAGKISAISKNARAYIALEHAEFDADIFKINCNNCTLVVRRPHEVNDGEPLIVAKPHDPADLITKLAPVDYDKDAGCPQFDKFLARVQPSEVQRRFILQWLGYSLTGDAEEQKLAVFWGSGRNGKGTLMETVAAIAGDYAESVPVETFLANPVQRGGGQATPDLAKLPGVRMLRCAEPDKGAKLGEALIKRVTGGDPIDARNLNKEFFTFFAQFKLTIACNYRPAIAGTDEGIWGRMILVPWTVFVPSEERDPQLKAKLRREASGILNRLLDGLRDWIEHGLVQGEEIKKATADYRKDSDAVGRFLEVCTASVAGERVQSSVLHSLYLAWAKHNDGPNYSVKGFSGILKDRGFQNIQNNFMFWIDLKLTKSEADFPVDQHGRPIGGQRSGDDHGGDAGGLSL